MGSFADLLKDKIEKQLDSWNADLDAAEKKAKAKEARAELDAADAQLEQKLLARVSDLKDKMTEARNYLEELLGGDDNKAKEVEKKYAKLKK
jgi:exonuclease VII large subunit